MTQHSAVLESVTVVLAPVVILMAALLVRRLRRLDGGQRSAHFFLLADRYLRFLVWLTVAAALFVVTPLTMLAYLVVDEGRLYVVHDAAHLAFIVVLLAGVARLWRRAGSDRALRPAP